MSTKTLADDLGEQIDDFDAMIAAKPDDTLVPRSWAARIAGVKVSTLAAWKTTGRYNLPVVCVGRLVKYRLGDLRRWLRDRTIHKGNGQAAA